MLTIGICDSTKVKLPAMIVIGHVNVYYKADQDRNISIAPIQKQKDRAP